MGYRLETQRAEKPASVPVSGRRWGTNLRDEDQGSEDAHCAEAWNEYRYSEDLMSSYPPFSLASPSVI
jgi:hypothetical protein